MVHENSELQDLAGAIGGERDAAIARAEKAEADLALKRTIAERLQWAFAALAADSDLNVETVRKHLHSPGNWRDFNWMVKEWRMEFTAKCQQAAPEPVAELAGTSASDAVAWDVFASAREPEPPIGEVAAIADAVAELDRRWPRRRGVGMSEHHHHVRASAPRHHRVRRRAMSA